MNKDTCAWADIENKSVAFSTLHLFAFHFPVKRTDLWFKAAGIFSI